MKTDTVSLIDFYTSTRLVEWMFILQESSVAPGWFVKVVNGVINGLGSVAAYLDDTIVSDGDPSRRVANMKELFLRLRSKISSFLLRMLPSVPRMRISSSPHHLCRRRHAERTKGRSVTKLPMQKTLKQLRSLLGALSYHRKSLRDTSAYSP